MTRTRVAVLTLLAMVAFAGNSLLCRVALRETGIDAPTFTMVRIVSGALVLWLIVRTRGNARPGSGSWTSAAALFAYAACFSFAYVSLSAGTGALLLFGAVQATMIGYGLWSGERLRRWQVVGLVLALGGLVGLVLPGVTAPPVVGSALMLVAGVAWGVYSLRGRSSGEPIRTTAENFARAVPMAVALGLASLPWMSFDLAGVGFAVLSGALASGLGYAVWYTAMRGLQATQAATVQLSVPVLAAAGGVLLLGEDVGLRLVLSSLAILGGIWIVSTDLRR
ncbi:MAG: DMT family transporter [Blastocatellia bacterium]|nr:DMT family transporter [Blastocatellia bacterium]